MGLWVAAGRTLKVQGHADPKLTDCLATSWMMAMGYGAQRPQDQIYSDKGVTVAWRDVVKYIDLCLARGFTSCKLFTVGQAVFSGAGFKTVAGEVVETY
jgi:hypothetical protein